MNWRTGFSIFSLCLLLLGGTSNTAFAVTAPDGSLVWHTYQGGDRDFDDIDRTGVYHDWARGVAQDSAGNLYVIGHSSGPWQTPVDAMNPVNPHTPVVDWNLAIGRDVFVAKFDPDGSLVWHTFLGAAPIDTGYCGFFGEDRGMGIAVDPSDNVLITGWSNWPWGPGAPSFTYTCRNEQAFVAKLDSTTGTLTWNTFLGASGFQLKDQGTDVTTDADGNVYVTGFSAHAAWPAPVTVRPYRANDAWVAKLDPAGNLLWNTFFGTTNGDSGESITLDASGNIYVTGGSSAGADKTFGFGSTPVESLDGLFDSFLVKLDNTGVLQWHTFLGGAVDAGQIEPGYGVDVDNAGHVFVTGRSYSTWGTPVNPYTGGENAFVAKLDADGNLLANTFMHRYGRDVAVDAAGHVFVTGLSIGGGGDAFACELDNDLNRQWCTKLFTPFSPELYEYCGGNDNGYGIVVSPDGYVYMAGESQYECIPDDFPLTPVNHHADYDESSGGMGLSTGDDMLLAKIKTGGGDIWGVSLNGYDVDNPGPSSLYRIDRATGAGTLVGTDLGYAVNSIAIDPTTGIMYAATTTWSGAFNGLLQVNTASGTATEIGAFGSSFFAIVGLTFDSTGQLWGWHEPSQDVLVQIDKTTGAAAIVGASGMSTFGQVMAFDSSDTLFLVQSSNVWTVNPVTGFGTPSGALSFDPGSGGAAFDPATGLMWASGTPGWAQDSVIRRTNIGGNSYTELDTDIEYLHAITISDAPFIADAVNTPPVATDDGYGAVEDTPLVVAAPGVLANDYDVDGDTPKVKQLTAPAHGGIVMFADGSFTYTPDPDYCGPDSLTYIVTDDPPITPPALDSAPATVSFDVGCVNDPPVAVGDGYGVPEDGYLDVPAPGVLGNDFDVDADTLTIKQLTQAVHGWVVMHADGRFTYTPNANFCGSDSFTYIATDDPPITPPALDSEPATVDIGVPCVNDPPLVISVVPATGIVDYSDNVTQVTITIEDIDSNLATLVGPSIRWSPGWEIVPDYLPDPRMNYTEVCVVVPNESIMDGTVCTYTLDGPIVEPGDQVFTLGFKGVDEDGDGPECELSEYYSDVSVCQHILTVEAEHAMVKLDVGNPVDELAPPGEDSEPFSLWFSAREISGPEDPLHGGGTAPGDLNYMIPYMRLLPVGPGQPVEGDCDWDDELEGGPDPAPPKPVADDGYAQIAYFQCDFGAVPVNTYEIDAGVEGGYYQGFDEGILVVYDPSLGFTTGGGFFYWPETVIPEDACLEYECLEYECAVFDTTECLEFNYDVCLVHDEEVCLVEDPCAGYLGDKTNFGFNFKYNKKQKNILGSLLMMRHTIDESCVEGNYKVKSNAIDGMGLGTATDGDGDYGWAAVTGKATFRDPEEFNSGGNAFLLYVEDHGEQGCSQNPEDEFWIEVILEPKLDGPTIWPDPLPREPADENSAIDGEDVPIFCGNIVVPHDTGGEGGGKGGGKGKPDK